MPPFRIPGPAQRDAGIDELLGQVAQGDTAAFERLYDQVAGPVYGLAVRILRELNGRERAGCRSIRSARKSITDFRKHLRRTELSA